MDYLSDSLRRNGGIHFGDDERVPWYLQGFRSESTRPTFRVQECDLSESSGNLIPKKRGRDDSIVCVHTSLMSGFRDLHPFGIFWSDTPQSRNTWAVSRYVDKNPDNLPLHTPTGRYCMHCALHHGVHYRPMESCPYRRPHGEKEDGIERDEQGREIRVCGGMDGLECREERFQGRRRLVPGQEGVACRDREVCQLYLPRQQRQPWPQAVDRVLAVRLHNLHLTYRTEGTTECLLSSTRDEELGIRVPRECNPAAGTAYLGVGWCKRQLKEMKVMKYPNGRFRGYQMGCFQPNQLREEMAQRSQAIRSVSPVLTGTPPEVWPEPFLEPVSLRCLVLRWHIDSGRPSFQYARPEDAGSMTRACKAAMAVLKLKVAIDGGCPPQNLEAELWRSENGNGPACAKLRIWEAPETESSALSSILLQGSLFRRWTNGDLGRGANYYPSRQQGRGDYGVSMLAERLASEQNVSARGLKQLFEERDPEGKRICDRILRDLTDMWMGFT